MRSVRAGRVTLLAVLPALAVTAAMLASPASAAITTPARPAATAAPARPAAPHWRAVSQGADGPAVAQSPAGTVASPPSIPVGTGPIHNGTFLSFSISDKVSLRVNVGSGDALLTTSDITVPEIGSSLTLGTSYNSLLVGSGVPQGAEGYGWRQREGVDVQLYPASSDNSVTLVGEDGTAGKFTPSSGNTYTSPGVFQASLLSSPTSGSCSGSAYSLTWHQTGELMCFNSSGLITSEVDRNGNTTAYSYCGCGHESTITYTPKGASSPTRTVSASYTGSYLTGLSENGGAAGTKNISYTVNASTGNLTSMTQADHSAIDFGYDSSHDLTSIENFAGYTTTLGYNSAHQVTSVEQQTPAGNASTRFDYVSSTETLVADPNTNQSDSVSSVPNVQYTIYSATSLVKQSQDQGNNIRKTSFNGVDNLTSATGAMSGETTTDSYNSNAGESLTSSQSPTGATSSSTYNTPGTYPGAAYLPSGSKDAQGNSSTYQYSGAGNLQQAQNALSATANVNYNSDGTPSTSTPPAGSQDQTSYAYTDGDHELNKITPPSGGSVLPTTITYDGFGRVATVSNTVNTVTYTYDLADRITRAAYTGGPRALTVNYTYDGAGNMKTQADPSGTVSWTYDGQNLVLTRTDTAGGGTESYVYDLDGNLTSAQDGGGITNYTYNNLNQLTEMTDPANNLWQFAYDADGRRIKTWFDTDQSESTWAAKMVTAYDLSGRISQVVTYENTSYSDMAFNMSYCYSPYVSGQSCPTALKSTDTDLVRYSTNNITGTVSQYTYDKGNRLTKATNVTGKTFSYGYDSNGNLTSGSTTGSLSYNADNQISNSGYHYDGEGNMTADNVNGTLTYNDAGQMVAASNADGVGTENFTYAGPGQDQLRSDGTATGITYGLSGQGGQPWVQSYTPVISGTPIYVLHDQQGTPLGFEHNGHVYFFATDNLGSVVALVDTSGGTAATYNWDPYGHLISQSGGEEDYNLIRYTGGLADMAYSASTDVPGTNDTHLGDRWQDPQLGAFIQPDSLIKLGDPQNANAYPYAADNPANYTDPTGQDVWGDLLAGVLTIGGTALAIAGLIVAAPALAVVGAVVALAGAVVFVDQMDCKYGGGESTWTIPGQCAFFG